MLANRQWRNKIVGMPPLVESKIIYPLPSHLLTTLHAPRVLHKPILHSQEFDPDNQLFQFNQIKCENHVFPGRSSYLDPHIMARKWIVYSWAALSCEDKHA